MPRIIDKERAEILQSTDEFIIDSAINGTRKVFFDTLKESLGAGGGSSDGGSANIEVDGALSSSSTNPVQNKVINTAINQTLAAAKSYTDNKVSNKMDQVTLATVATTGDYNDLKNKPTLPNLSNLAKVATSGSYNDLIDRPAIPEIPTLVSELTNDVGYITEAELPVLPEVPTKLSELENDTNFVTEEQVNSRTEINNAVIGDTSTWSSSKIASEMQWKFLGNLTTAGDLSDVVPDTANEICIVRISDSTIKDFSLILPIIALPNFGTGTNYVDNFITGATEGIEIGADKKVKLNSTLESLMLKIYYR